MRCRLATNYFHNFHEKLFCTMLSNCRAQLPRLVLGICTLNVLEPPTTEALGHVSLIDVGNTDIDKRIHLQLIHQVKPV
jgi:hypothetical protein